uniref:Uncharacterized protein n=1 Tax=Helianthus annuus TaxID=4232 RepID=A0A251RR44_HELAN
MNENGQKSESEVESAWIRLRARWELASVLNFLQVRAVCKPLKAFGIHTVSPHSGASVDHQGHG